MSNGLDSWIVRLREEASAPLRELLRGSASLGPLSAAEPEDAIAAILDLEPRDSQLFRSFDTACSQLLEEIRTSPVSSDVRSYRVDLSRLHTLISIVRRLLPDRTVVDLHKRFSVWSGFFETFVLDQSFDLREEYFRVLALSQEHAALEGLAPRRLMPLWLSICAESGAFGRYDQRYLRVAMLGLRKLPLGDEFSANEDFALQGLARWAVTQRPPKTAFEREWRILQGHFPREAGYWADRVGKTVTAAESELAERTHRKEHTFELAAWWRQDVGQGAFSRTWSSAGHVNPVPMNQWKPLLQGIGGAYAEVAPKIDRMMISQRRYADVTGDVFYLVRTACNFGMRLINAGTVHERRVRGIHAVSLAALAFHYDPTNVFAWSLMRDALATAGRLEDSQLVGWEAVRRFPENEQWRNQLATLLAFSAGKAAEAVALLRETAALFPADAFSRNQLATVLADELDDRDAAFVVLKSVIEDGLGDEATLSILAKLHAGRPLRSMSKPRVVLSDDSRLSVPSAVGRRLVFQFESGLIGTDEVRAFLVDAPHDAYLTYVAERTDTSNLPLKTTFALAFDDALRRADSSKLRAMVALARPIEKVLIEEAIAASGGTVVPFPPRETHAPQFERLESLGRVLRQPRRSADSTLRLLRDFAASALSTNITFLAAA